ncbi:MAG: chondroitin lyase [Gemmatimonadaceae bacterium]|nr:chondroitin lyase [Chitinophagaceae bacterium]
MSKYLLRLVVSVSMLFFCHSGVVLAGVSNDLEIIRQRVIADLLNEKEVERHFIDKLFETLKPDGSWPDINYKDLSRTAFQHSRHLMNMLDMSRAYRKPGSPLKGNANLKKAISSALDLWLANDFICENWWWNEMGTPNLMINTLLVMDEELTEKQKTDGLRIAGRANLRASGARPGGDLIQIAGMLGKQALFARNELVLDTVVRTMASEIKVTTGRGLKPDMSFHHRVDNVISTLTYGTGYANAFAYWAVKIAGTKYSLPDSASRLLIDYFIDGISQSMIYRMYPDPGAMNRDITRRNAVEEEGLGLPENLAKISTYRAKELEEIIKVRSGKLKPSFTKDRFFWHSSYLTHQRPLFFVSVRMHSSRASNMEQPHNEEGILNHHYGDGSNFISRTGKEFTNIFPVWDWQKIPGTTVLQKPEMPHWNVLAKKGLTDFSGAATDGHYTVAGFDFSSVHDPLTARKSWFFFDREYVCLGAAINTTADLPVFTTVNQTLLNGAVKTRDAKGQRAIDTGRHLLSSTTWIHHDSVGYLFHSPTTIAVYAGIQKGNWRRINHQAWATTEEVSENIFSAWFDHGRKVKNASYQYIVLPAVAVKELETYSKKNDVVILSNSADLQAVQHKGLNLTQAVFYKPGGLQIAKDIFIKVDQPCILMLHSGNGMIDRIHLAEPTHKLQTIQLTATDKSKKEKSMVVQLGTGGDAGKTVRVL